MLFLKEDASSRYGDCMINYFRGNYMFDWANGHEKLAPKLKAIRSGHPEGTGYTPLDVDAELAHKALEKGAAYRSALQGSSKKTTIHKLPDELRERIQAAKPPRHFQDAAHALYESAGLS
jgi:hypothetical protein